MVDQNGAQHATNFTLSIEAAEGISTGISAAERAHTIRTAVAAHAKPSDIVQPGHIFPIDGSTRRCIAPCRSYRSRVRPHPFSRS